MYCLIACYQVENKYFMQDTGTFNFKFAYLDSFLREPLSILIKYKTIDTPKVDNILKIYSDVSTKL